MNKIVYINKKDQYTQLIPNKLKYLFGVNNTSFKLKKNSKIKKRVNT